MQKITNNTRTKLAMQLCEFSFVLAMQFFNPAEFHIPATSNNTMTTHDVGLLITYNDVRHGLIWL